MIEFKEVGDGTDHLICAEAHDGYHATALAANPARDDVDVTLQVAPEGTHVLQLRFGELDEAGEAVEEVARFFTRHLS